MGYPLPFIDNIIRTFKERNIVDQNNETNDNDDKPLLPTYFFEVNKRFILLKLPFRQNNEIKSKHFLKKFHHFTKNYNNNNKKNKNKSLILQSVGKQGKYKLCFI